MKKIVIDEGSSQVKICWFDGEKIQTDVFPSRVVRDARMGPDHKKLDSTYKVGHQKFTVDPTMDGAIPTDDPEDYQVNRINRILVHESLRRNGFGGQQVSIITTLPVEMFYNEDEKNEALISAKKENLISDDIENLVGHELANIQECQVSPEAIPAWYDMVLDDTGQEKIATKKEYKIMVVDIGGTTTDISIIDGFGYIQEFKSVASGVFQIGKRLKTILSNEMELDGLQTYEIDGILKNKKAEGKYISGMIDDASDKTITDVLYAMRSMVKESKRLNAVLYVGGGANLIGKSLAMSYGGETIFGDEMSIARGILKLQLSQAG